MRTRRTKKTISLAVAAALTVLTPMQALASPQFAYDSETWARLQDNVMEYSELQSLVEEYNPTYLNNQTTYRDSKTTEDARTIRNNKYENAYDAYDRADDLRSQAEDYLDMGLASVYSGLISAAIATENTAIKTEQEADASYRDSEMDRLDYMNQQNGVIFQVQGQFASYNQVKKSIPGIEKNLEVQRASYSALERQVQQGLATQTDLLNARKNLQSLESTYTQTKATLETQRQNLCVMTGWSYDAQPEIQDLPDPDLTRIETMNPDVDIETALAANLSLQSNRRGYANMAEGSADKKNMERKIKNQEENIKAGIRNLYSDVLQKRTALQLAETAMASETVAMNAAKTKQ